MYDRPSPRCRHPVRFTCCCSAVRDALASLAGVVAAAGSPLLAARSLVLVPVFPHAAALSSAAAPQAAAESRDPNTAREYMCQILLDRAPARIKPTPSMSSRV